MQTPKRNAYPNIALRKKKKKYTDRRWIFIVKSYCLRKKKDDKSERATCHYDSIFDSLPIPFSLFVKPKIPCENHEPKPLSF